MRDILRRSFLGSFFLVGSSIPVFADAGSGGDMWDGDHQMMYGMGGFGMLMMLGLFVLIIMAVVLLVRGSSHSQHRHSNTEVSSRPIEILDERYARGEIDHDEYEERKRRLK